MSAMSLTKDKLGTSAETSLQPTLTALRQESTLKLEDAVISLTKEHLVILVKEVVLATLKALTLLARKA